MKRLGRFIDPRRTTEGKALALVLSLAMVWSQIGTVPTALANGLQEGTAPAAAEQPVSIDYTGELVKEENPVVSSEIADDDPAEGASDTSPAAALPSDGSRAQSGTESQPASDAEPETAFEEPGIAPLSLEDDGGIATYASNSSTTLKISAGSITNAEVAYVYFTSAAQAATADFTPVASGASQTVANFSADTAADGHAGYVVFFLKPTNGTLITGITASGAGNICAIDDAASVYSGYPGMADLVARAKDKGYIACFGFSRVQGSSGTVDASFSVEGVVPTLTVSASSNKTSNVKPGDVLTFTVTIAPATSVNNTALTPGEPVVKTLTVNGEQYSISGLTKGADGSWAGTVQYTATEDDCKSGAVRLEVVADVAYTYAFGIQATGSTVRTTVTTTADASCLCAIAPKATLSYQFAYRDDSGAALDATGVPGVALPGATDSYLDHSVSVDVTLKEGQVVLDGARGGYWIFGGWCQGSVAAGEKVVLTASSVTLTGTWTFHELTASVTAQGWTYDGAPHVGDEGRIAVSAVVDACGENIPDGLLSDGPLLSYYKSATDGSGAPAWEPVEGDPVDAGTYRATATWTLADGSSFSVLADFVVSPRPVTLTSGSANRPYDGTALTAPDVAIDDEVLASQATAVATGSQTAVGSRENTICVTGIDGMGYKESNYAITYVPGTLTVDDAVAGIVLVESLETASGDAEAMALADLDGDLGIMLLDDGDDAAGDTAAAYTAGDTVTFSMFVENESNVVLRNVILSNSLLGIEYDEGRVATVPPDTAYYVNNRSEAVTVDSSDGPVTVPANSVWVEKLDLGGSVTVYGNYTVQEDDLVNMTLYGMPVVDTSTVTADSPVGQVGDESGAVAPVVGAQVSLNLANDIARVTDAGAVETVTDEAPFQLGEKALIVSVVQNTSNVTLYDMRLSGVLADAAVERVEVNGQAIDLDPDGDGICTVSQMAPGDQVVVYRTYVVRDHDVAADYLSDTVHAVGYSKVQDNVAAHDHAFAPTAQSLVAEDPADPGDSDNPKDPDGSEDAQEPSTEKPATPATPDGSDGSEPPAAEAPDDPDGIEAPSDPDGSDGIEEPGAQKPLTPGEPENAGQSASGLQPAQAALPKTSDATSPETPAFALGACMLGMGGLFLALRRKGQSRS